MSKLIRFQLASITGPEEYRVLDGDVKTDKGHIHGKGAPFKTDKRKMREVNLKTDKNKYRGVPFQTIINDMNRTNQGIRISNKMYPNQKGLSLFSYVVRFCFDGRSVRSPKLT